MLSKRILSILAMVLLVPTLLLAQNTTSGMRGLVKIAGGQPLVGATVTVTHEPTGTVYKTQTRTGGTYVLNNMNPGGPYTIVVTFVNYGTETLNEVYVGLGEVATIDVNLKEKGNDLGNVVVTTIQNKKGDFSGKGGAETTIGKEKLDNLPSVGRNLQDFLRFVPQAKISGSDGNLAGISFGGQNNRYNSFYIDGAANNDQFGLASSGTNGGQTGGAPISIDALDQIQVVLSPYDASIGN
ncbi:MAG TPA: TonB-dependent receptor, partial [Chitinophagaceae bacterium]|nr:TonB-dependent receptor [Chitinophagaceae bacterium]